jgi:hypothetical protein
MENGIIGAAWGLLGVLCSLGLGFFRKRFLWYGYLLLTLMIIVRGCLAN